MSRITRLQHARTPPRRRSRAWHVRRWVWMVDRVEYACGSGEGIAPWGVRVSCGWCAPSVIHLRLASRLEKSSPANPHRS